MDLRKIKKLIDLLEESNLVEIEIKEGEESVRLARQHVSGQSTFLNTPIAPTSAASLPSPTDLTTSAALATTPSTQANALPEGHLLYAPMVGTFYTSPSPDKPSFVSVGQHVKIGDTVAIIEAMKTFNPIEADASGKIVAILAKNGQPVEYEQPLFVIG